MQYFSAVSLSVMAALCACQQGNGLRIDQRAGSSEQHLTILATNDIHGAMEAETKALGGFAFWSGAVKAIRAGLSAQFGSDGDVILVDAGDQFQGTLLSNYSEGLRTLQILQSMGYDAAVPGNHAYDFGPIGWDVDQSTDPTKRLQSLEKAAEATHFPFLSANTYLKSSLHDSTGKQVQVDSTLCAPIAGSSAIDWSRAQQPSFIRPYRVVERAGIRVALIGIDDPRTQKTTTADNVEDLCFADEYESYVRAHRELESKADVFVLIIHRGNTDREKPVTELVTRLTSSGQRLVDAVISGHTHYTYHLSVNQVPIVQSGANGISFGRVDLVWDPSQGQVLREKTVMAAGLRLYHDRCPPAAQFCKTGANKTVFYEGQKVTPDADAQKLIDEARKEVAPLADRVVGYADEEIRRERINESALLNIVTDLLRFTAKADVAVLNTGGVRENLKQGPVNYELLFRTIPFSNHALVIGPVSTEKLLEALTYSARTCGSYGALMQSGLKVKIERTCSPGRDSGIDPNARVLEVQTVEGELIYRAKPNPVLVKREFNVVSVDFLINQGEGLTAFVGIPVLRDIGILRDALAERLAEKPPHWQNKIDGRWVNVINSGRGNNR